MALAAPSGLIMPEKLGGKQEKKSPQCRATAGPRRGEGWGPATFRRQMKIDDEPRAQKKSRKETGDIAVPTNRVRESEDENDLESLVKVQRGGEEDRKEKVPKLSMSEAWKSRKAIPFSGYN